MSLLEIRHPHWDRSPWNLLGQVAGHRGQRAQTGSDPQPRREIASEPRSAATGDDVAIRIAAEVRDMVQDGRVPEARARLNALSPELQRHPKLAGWVRVLRPPEVRIGAPGSTPSIRKDAEWLRAHAAEHFGNWVALRQGVLLGSHPDPVVLNRDLEARNELDGAVFVRITHG